VRCRALSVPQPPFDGANLNNHYGPKVLKESARPQ
jgi:hypothetical protein